MHSNVLTHSQNTIFGIQISEKKEIKYLNKTTSLYQFIINKQIKMIFKLARSLFH